MVHTSAPCPSWCALAAGHPFAVVEDDALAARSAAWLAYGQDVGSPWPEVLESSRASGATQGYAAAV